MPTLRQFCDNHLAASGGRDTTIFFGGMASMDMTSSSCREEDPGLYPCKVVFGFIWFCFEHRCTLAIERISRMRSLDLPLLLFDLAMRAVGPFVQAFPRKVETKQNKTKPNAAPNFLNL